MSLLYYKRPDYACKNNAPMDESDHRIYLERQRAAIPTELCFEYVVSNRALPPCSLQDFMGFLLYVSHEAENLQFYLWFQDYAKRFLQISTAEQALSPPWDEDLAQAINNDQGPTKTGQRSPMGIDFEFDFDNRDIPLDCLSDKRNGSMKSNHLRAVESANVQIGLKWQSFTIQPFRAEINRVISHYLAPGSPREINISQRDRAACLHALQHTTHPSALAIPVSIVTDSLRNQSHPNFIRWSMANGNRPRIIFGRTLGVLHIIFGFLIAIVLTMSKEPRWWRLFGGLAWFLGFNFLLCGANGICLVLYATHNRHLRPWEQYSNESWSSQNGTAMSDEMTLALSYDIDSPVQHSGRNKCRVALEAFGTANSYGHEVWVEKYRAKMMVRKVFDRTVWVQNENIRIMQDKVALQGLIWSVIVTVPLTVLFTAVPSGNFF